MELTEKEKKIVDAIVNNNDPRFSNLKMGIGILLGLFSGFIILTIFLIPGPLKDIGWSEMKHEIMPLTVIILIAIQFFLCLFENKHRGQIIKKFYTRIQELEGKK